MEQSEADKVLLRQDPPKPPTPKPDKDVAHLLKEKPSPLKRIWTWYDSLKVKPYVSGAGEPEPLSREIPGPIDEPPPKHGITVGIKVSF